MMANPNMMGGPNNIGGPTMMAQKSLPPTPHLTPALSHRGVTPAQAIQSSMVGRPAMQQGFTVGPGEAPNSAGPFVNGGLHNTSDDSILTGQGSLASARVSHHPDQSLESLGGTQHHRQQETQPLVAMGRPQTKLVPGRMSGRGAPSPGPHRAQASRPQSRGPEPRPQSRGPEPGARPQSRAGKQARIIPSTSVPCRKVSHDPGSHLNVLNHSIGETDTL